MLRTMVKIALPCLLVLVVLVAALSMEMATKKNPGLTDAGEKSQAEMAEVYGPATVPTVPAATEETAAPEAQPTEPVQTDPVQEEPVQTESAMQDRYVLTFLGDCTFGSPPASYFAQMGFVKTVGENYGYPFENVRSYVEEDDFTFLNLEGPLCDNGNPVRTHSFHGPSDFISILTENSVEGVTLANNHIMDYGQKGYDSTTQLLRDAKIPYVEDKKTVLVTLTGGLTVGIYGGNYVEVNKADIAADISALKQQGADLVIFAAHWGRDGYYDATKDQTALAHAAIDAGANIVYGTHPHVLQPIESYNGGVIFYSLGNFSFGGNGSPKDYDTAVIQQEVLVNADGTVSLGEHTVIPCSVSSASGRNNFQPIPYEEGTRGYDRVLEKLSGTYALATVNG